MSASCVKRVQGRPARGDGDVGRERVVEAARSILRAKAAPEISRKAVADAAGVTPALVSYYFPDKDSLMAAATEPLIDRLAQLLAILDSSDSRQDRLQRIVSFLVRLNASEARLIDYSIAFCRREAADPQQRSRLLNCYDRMRTFCLEGSRAGAWRTLNPDMVLFALWGMCKAVAECKAEGYDLIQDGADDPRVLAITDLALNGLASR